MGTDLQNLSFCQPSPQSTVLLILYISKPISNDVYTQEILQTFNSGWNTVKRANHNGQEVWYWGWGKKKGRGVGGWYKERWGSGEWERGRGQGRRWGEVGEKREREKVKDWIDWKQLINKQLQSVYVPFLLGRGVLGRTLLLAGTRRLHVGTLCEDKPSWKKLDWYEAVRLETPRQMSLWANNHQQHVNKSSRSH